MIRHKNLCFFLALCFSMVSICQDTQAGNPGISIKRTVKEGRMEFLASGSSQLEFDIFVFDMDGKLVTRASGKMNQKIVLERMSRGTYFFEIFNNDLRIENGSLMVP